MVEGNSLSLTDHVILCVHCAWEDDKWVYGNGITWSHHLLADMQNCSNTTEDHSRHMPFGFLKQTCGWILHCWAFHLTHVEGVTVHMMTSSSSLSVRLFKIPMIVPQDKGQYASKSKLVNIIHQNRIDSHLLLFTFKRRKERQRRGRGLELYSNL